MSHFAFLQHEWPAVFEAAGKAEEVFHADPRTACFFARHVTAVEKLKAAYRASLAQLDALFASLQHRAFRGEL